MRLWKRDSVKESLSEEGSRPRRLRFPLCRESISLQQNLSVSLQE